MQQDAFLLADRVSDPCTKEMYHFLCIALFFRKMEVPLPFLALSSNEESDPADGFLLMNADSAVVYDNPEILCLTLL
jgi:hypothetical protein